MTTSFITLLLFQVLGEAAAFALSVPIPGPVIGMILLLIWLIAKQDQDSALIRSSTRFLRHLSLLFIPAAVGIMTQFDRLAAEWPAILAGVAGALMTQAVLGRLRLSDPCTHGFTLGVVAHGIGAARAMQISPRDGAFAGLGMGLAGLLTAVCLPLAFRLAGY
ncbi:CidA/LrgA family protein [Castellaniella ginsengisoli]|uniref:CidA/LrgA family protein n=1 Tax=Castellaniella ginsengisoli TaxID=546114 RepID=A0AB39ESD6_9BURK